MGLNPFIHASLLSLEYPFSVIVKSVTVNTDEKELEIKKAIKKATEIVIADNKIL